MSCRCGQCGVYYPGVAFNGGSCCQQCGCNYTVVLPDNPNGYNALNVNTAGVGVVDSVTGPSNNVIDFNFRGIVSTSAALTVALNAGAHTIELTVDIDEIIAELPQATTTQAGIGETATDAESIAKASTTVFLTPSNLAALGASLTFAGLVELATDAETQAGISTTLAVTPAGLASVVQGLLTTQTFVDAVGRGGTFPDFDGQFGAQLDTNAAYVSTGTNAGDWIGILTLGSVGNELTAATTVDTNTFTFTLNGAGVLALDSVALTVSNNATASTFNNGVLRFGDSSSLVFDWGASTDLYIAAAQVPSNSVLGTAAAGVPTSRLLNTFLSTANTQPYGAISGGVSRSPYTVYGGQTISNPPTQAEVQALDDAVAAASALLGAIVTDLKNTQKPST